jgi:hypothetical protein
VRQTFHADAGNARRKRRRRQDKSRSTGRELAAECCVSDEEQRVAIAEIFHDKWIFVMKDSFLSLKISIFRY